MVRSVSFATVGSNNKGRSGRGAPEGHGQRARRRRALDVKGKSARAAERQRGGEGGNADPMAQSARPNKRTGGRSPKSERVNAR